MSRLVFTDKGHEYTLDGERVPSVSTIVRKVSPSENLVGWGAKLSASWCATNVDALPIMGVEQWIEAAASEPNTARNKGGRTGRAVHSIAERLIAGEPVEPVDPDTGVPYPDDVVRMGEQVARFLDAWDVEPETALVERPVFHETLRYAGRFDLDAILRGGDRWMIDYKTSPSGAYPEAALQTTGYARATHVVIDHATRGPIDMLMPPVDRCGVLWVRPDFWQLIPVKSDDEVWQAFCHAIPVAAFNSQPRKAIVGGALPVPSEVA